MDIFLYAMIFIAGTVFGSFCTLAVYRIPRKENITYVRSHCVSCNHKLAALDLIPIFSYLFLGGKCRYCKEKIRSRYILLEISSGFVFLLIALALKIIIYSSIFEFLRMFIIFLFVTGAFIIGGIDKEKYIIPNSLIIYLSVISIINNIINIYFKINILNNLIGLIAMPLFFILINLIFKLDKTKEEPIGYGDIKYLSVIGFFMGFGAQVIIFVISLIIALIGHLIKKYKQIPLGYYISIALVFVIIFNNYLSEVINLISIS